jgi:hypothetical protein
MRHVRSCRGRWQGRGQRATRARHRAARFAQAVSRGAARCASQVLDRGAYADARGATHVLDRGVQAVSRGAARCALHVYMAVVPGPMPAAVASWCCRRRFQHLVCACGS